MKRATLLIILSLALFSAQAQSRNWVNMNEDWKFTKGNPADAEAVNFDDSSWEEVTVPHDWAITGPFNEAEPGFTGKLPWKGEGWYRKNFRVAAADKGKIVYFLFDGIMAFPKVYINGKPAGEWDYGYNSFYLDVTGLINFGGENTRAV